MPERYQQPIPNTIPDDELKRLEWKARGDVCRFNSVNHCFSKYSSGLEGKSMLDIGCGRTYPQVVLYNTRGLKSVGIDVDQFAAPGRANPSDAYFFSKLEEAFGRELNFDGIELHNVDITQAPFASESFDLVVSNMVFEHIPDVPLAVAELYRIMKPKAITNIGIHLYPSLSGQHHPQIWGEEVHELPPQIEPWFHLRGLPGLVDDSLNKWRERQYLEVFRRCFEILELQYPHFEQGRKFMTPEILLELPDFSEEELLRVWITIVARKN